MSNANVNANFTANTNGFNKAIDAVKKNLTDLSTKTIKNLNTVFGGFNKTLTLNEQTLSNTDKVLKTLNKTTSNTVLNIGTATKAFTAFMAVQDKLMIAQTGVKIFSITANAIKDVVSSLSSLDDAFKAMDISGISRESINEFALLQDAIKGNQQALEAFSLSAVSRYNKFAEELAYVNTMLGYSKEELSDYGDDLLAVVNGPLKNAVSSSEALAGAYEVVGAGFTDAAASQQVMVAGMKLATTGASDQGSTMQLLGKVLNALGEDSSEAGKRAAGIFEIVKQGISTVSELTIGLGQTTTVAKAAGVSFEEVGAGVARLTAAGKSTPSALTGLESLYRIIIDKTPQAEKALSELRDSAGKPIKFDKREIETKGLVKAIQDLNDAVGGNEAKLASIIPESQAFGTFLSLAADNAEVFKQKVIDMGKATEESLDIGFAQKLDNTRAKFQAISNQFAENMLMIGKAIAPAFEGGVEALSALADIVSFITPGIAKILEVALPLIKTIAKITGAVTALVTAASGIASVIISFRAFDLLMKGQLPRQISIIKQLALEQKNWFAAILQTLGINKEHLLVTKRTQEEYAKLKNKTDDLIKQSESVKNAEDKLNKVKEQSLKTIDKEQKTIDNLVDARNKLIEQRKQTGAELDLDPTNNSLSRQLDLTDRNISKTNELIQIETEKQNRSKIGISNAEKELQLAKQQALIIKDENGKIQDLNKELEKHERNMEGAVKANETLRREREKLEKLTNKYKDNLKELNKIESNIDNTKTNIEQLTSQRRKLYNVIKTGSEEEIKKAQEQIVLINERIKQEELLLKFETKRKGRQQDKVNVSNTAVKEQELIIEQKNAAVKEHLIKISQRKAEIDELEVNAIRLSNAAKKQAVLVDAMRADKTVDITKLQEAEKLSLELNTKATEANSAVKKAKNALAKEESSLIRQQLIAEGRLTELRVLGMKFDVQTNAVTKVLNGELKTTVKNTISYINEKRKLISAYIAENAVKAKNITLSTLQNIANKATASGDSTLLKIRKLFTEQGREQLALDAKQLAMNLMKGNSFKLLGTSIGSITVATTLAAAGVVALGAAFVAASTGMFEYTTETAKEFRNLNDKVFGKYKKTLEEINQEQINNKNTIKVTTAEVPLLEKAFNGLWNAAKGAWRTVFAPFYQGAYNKDMRETAAAVSNIQDATIGLIKTNKELESGKALSVESNNKIRQGIKLTIADFEREEKLFNKRREAIDDLIEGNEAAIKSLRELASKEDDEQRKAGYESRIKLIAGEIDKLKERGKEFEKQFENEKSLLEARNKLLERAAKYDMTKVSSKDIVETKKKVEETSKEILNIADTLSTNVNKKLLTNAKQFANDMENNTLAAKSIIEQLGADSSKFTQEELNTINEAFEFSTLKRKEMWGKLSKEEKDRFDELKKKGIRTVTELFQSEEIKKKFKELGVDVTKLSQDQLHKIGDLFTKAQGDIAKIDKAQLRSLANSVTNTENAIKTQREKFINSLPEIMGKSPIETAIKKDLKKSEDALSNTLLKMEAYLNNASTKFDDINVIKFIDKATTDNVKNLEEELQRLGIAIDEVKPENLEKLKTAIAGKNANEIKQALKEIGVEINKTFTGNEISIENLERDVSNFIESLNAGVEQGFITSEEAAKRMDDALIKLKGKLDPDVYIDLINQQIEFEKTASKKRIDLYQHQSSMISQLENGRLLAGVNTIKFLGKLEEKQLEENIKTIEKQLQKYKEAGLDNSENYKELERQLTTFQTQQIDLRIKNIEREIDAVNEATKEGLDTRKDILEEQTLQGIRTKKEEAKALYEIEQESIKADIKSIHDKIARFTQSKDEIIAKAKQAGMSQIEAENAYQTALDKLNRQGIKQRITLLKSETNERQRLLDEQRKEISDKFAKETALLQEKNSKGLISEYETSKEIIEIKQKELTKKIELAEKEIELAKARGEDVTAMEAALSNLRSELNRTVTEATLNAIDEQNKIMEDGIADQRRLVEQNMENRVVTEEEGAKQLTNIRQKELDNTIKDLEAKKAAYQQSGKSTREIENQIQDARLEKVKVTNQQILKSLSDTQAKLAGLSTKKTLTIELANASGNKTELQAAREIAQVKQEQLRETNKLLEEQLKLSKSEKERIDIQNQILQNQKEQKQIATDILLKEVEHQNKLLSDKTGDAIREQEKLAITGATTEIDMEKKVTQIKIDELSKREELIKKQIEIYKKSGKDTIDLENQLQDSRVEKIKLSNAQILKDFENLSNKTKILNDKKLIYNESKLLKGLQNEEQMNKNSYKLKLKSLDTEIELIKQRISIYKKQGKDIGDLENQLQNTINEKVKTTNAEILRDLELTANKTKLINERKLIDNEVKLLKGLQTEKESNKQIYNLKLKSLEDESNLIKKRIDIYKKQGKDIRELENQLQNNKAEKLRIVNEEIIKDLELLANKTKLINERLILQNENRLLNGLQNEEQTNNKIYELKQKSLNDEETLITKRIQIYKKQGKEVTELENQLQNIKNEKIKLSNEQQLKNLELLSIKTKAINDKSSIENETRLLKGLQNEEEANKKSYSLKLETLNDEELLIKKRIELYKKQGKNVLELENQLQNIKNEKIKLSNEQQLKDLELLSSKTRDINNKLEIENETRLFKGLQTEEQTDKKLYKLKLESLDNEESLIKQRIELYKKQGKNILDLENQLQRTKNDKLKIRNEEVLKDLEKLANKTKLITDKQIIQSELAALNGLKTEEEVNNKIYNIKLKSFHDDESIIKKRIYIYKQQGKNTLELENNLLNINKARKQAEFEQELKNIELQQSKILSIQNKRINEIQILTATGNKTEINAAKETTAIKIQQINIQSNAIIEQIKAYKKVGKDVRALEEQLQKYRLDKIQIANAQASADLENYLKDKEIALSKEKALIDLDFKTKRITYEQYEDLQIDFQHKELQLREETINKRINLMKKEGKDTRDLEKELQQIQIQRQDLVTQKLISNLEKQKRANELFFNSQKQQLDKQLQSIDFISKSMEIQKQLQDSKISLLQAELEIENQQIDLEKRKTNDLRTQADLTYKQAVKRFESLQQQQEIEKQNIEYQIKSNKVAEQREELQIKSNKLQIQQQKAQLQIDLLRARTENKSKLEIQALEQQLDLLDDQLIFADKTAQQQREQRNITNEILQNQIKQNKAKQELAMEGGLLDIEIAKLDKQKAISEAIIQDMQMQNQIMETRGNTELQTIEHINKQYQEQQNILQQKQSLLNELQGLYEQNMSIVIGSAKNEYKQRDLRISVEKTKLQMLKEQQKIDNAIFELGLKQKKLELEKLEIQQKFNKAKAQSEIYVKQAAYQNTISDPRSSEIEKKRAALDLYTAQMAMKELEVGDEILKQQKINDEKFASITRTMNAMKQENQLIGANQSIASLTTNKADDDIVARYAGEQAGRNLNIYRDIANTLEPNDVTPLKIDTSDIEKALQRNLEEATKKQNFVLEESKKQNFINKPVEIKIPPGTNLKIDTPSVLPITKENDSIRNYQQQYIQQSPIALDSRSVNTVNKISNNSNQVIKQEKKVEVSAPVTINIELNREQATDQNAAQTLGNTFHRQLQNVIKNASYNS